MSEKTKIVMIDDEQDLCLMVKESLEETGDFEVVTSSKPEEAMALCQQEKPGIILLDNVMPDKKGSEIIKEVRDNEETKHIPIIVISGKGEMVYSKKKDQFQWQPSNPVVRQRGEIIDEKNPQKAAEAYGVEDYIAKPFTTEILISVIQDVLKKTQKKKEQDNDAAI